MKTLDEKIEIMKHFNSGGEVEFLAVRRDSRWQQADTPIWDWNTYDYRKKPRKPNEKWGNEYHRKIGENSWHFHDSVGQAKRYAADAAIRVAVHYREVIDD